MEPARKSETYVDTTTPRPVVVGTDIKVSQIASELEHRRMSPDEIVEAHPHLTLAAVHGALAYYYDHPEEIRAEWREAHEVIVALRDRFRSRARERT